MTDKLTNGSIERTKSQMRKGILEYCILLILQRRECYSNDIITILKSCRLILVEGTLYPLLSRLKNDGMLSYTWIESNQGPPRKYYRITDKGMEILDGLKGEWDEIRNTVDTLTDESRMNELTEALNK